MTACDYFLWSYLKNLVYADKTNKTIEKIKEAITRHVTELRANPELLHKVVRAATDRVQQCIAADGGHFEGEKK